MFGPVVLIPFKYFFSTLSSRSHLVWQSLTICAIIVEAILTIISVCLILYVQVNNFSVMLGLIFWVEPVLSKN